MSYGFQKHTRRCHGVHRGADVLHHTEDQTPCMTYTTARHSAARQARPAHAHALRARPTAGHARVGLLH